MAGSGKEFAELRRKEIEADAPREEDVTLPGWVSNPLIHIIRRRLRYVHVELNRIVLLHFHTLATTTYTSHTYLFST